ncbi:hypothetical protein BSKO_04226 [Bryopsis sp. KO-2023]|nr:hypothetical protein BSKO_04226 [Bryopsis sp. KO-2023]
MQAKLHVSIKPPSFTRGTTYMISMLAGFPKRSLEEAGLEFCPSLWLPWLDLSSVDIVLIFVGVHQILGEWYIVVSERVFFPCLFHDIQKPGIHFQMEAYRARHSCGTNQGFSKVAVCRRAVNRQLGVQSFKFETSPLDVVW